MALNNTPISRNLRMTARFLGLEIEDLFILAMIAVFLMIGSQVVFPKVVVFKISLNFLLFISTFVVGVPALSSDGGDVESIDARR